MPIVVKVGGSLFDHPGLFPALRQWLGEQPQRALLVPGGGPAADVVRQYHRTHHLKETDSHWLAIRMMDINGALLRGQLGDAADVVEAFEFCRSDEGNPLSLGHTWRVTSDAIAARIAEHRGAGELVLLKSIDLPERISWQQAAEAGLVDHAFPTMITRGGIPVRWVNFRTTLARRG